MNYMEKNVMFKMTYGLYVLTAKEGDFQNGCIIDAAMQITDTPLRLCIAVNKKNKTCEMIDRTGEFNLSVLTDKTAFEVFSHFGFQSGRDVDKLSGWNFKKMAGNGIVYITNCTNAYLCCRVVDKTDQGTHILFFADVLDGENLSKEPSVSYAYYQEKIKTVNK